MATLVKSSTLLTTANDTGSSTNITFIETSAATTNFYKIQDTAEKATLILRGSGDTVLVENLSDAFQLKVVGKTVFLNGDSQTIQLNLTKPTSTSTTTSVNVEFLDGSTTIVGTYASGKVTWKVGGQTLTNKYADFVPTTALGTATNAETAFDDSTSGGSSGSTTVKTLTTGLDALSGTSGDDTFSAAAGTLSTVDEVSGGAGTDTMTITFAPIYASAASATAAAASISGVEVINLTNNIDTATFNMANVAGVTALTVGGRNTLGVTNIEKGLTAVNVSSMSALLTVDQATATASTAAYGLTLNLSASTAADIIWDDDTGSTALNDTLTLNAQGDWKNTTATRFGGVETLVIKGAGNVTFNMQSANATAYIDLTANNTGVGIDASGLSGNLTLSVDAGDMSIKGGAGNDTFNMTASLTTNDSLDGGAGTDELKAQVSGYLRPIISNVETFSLNSDGTAMTADFRDVSGVSTVNLMVTTAANVLDRVQTSVATINVNSSDSTANTLSVQFGTAAVASNLTLNLGNAAQGSWQTAAATASALAIGTVTMSGNSGALSIVTNSTANYSADALEVNDFTAVTLHAASGNILWGDIVDVNTAQTVNVTLAAGKTMTIADDFCADGATVFALSVGQSGTFGLTGASASLNNTGATVTLAAGASALIDMSGSFLQLCGATALGMSVGAGGVITAGTVLLGEVGATAGSGAVAMNTISLSAAGTINIGAMSVASAADTAINMTINAVMSSTAAVIGISGFTINDNVGAGTASEQSVSINISGTGSFTLSAAATNSSNVTYKINATGMASGAPSNLTINLSNINDTGSVASAVFGAASGLYVGVDGVDNVEFGFGAMTVEAGLGNDVITMGNSAVNAVRYSAAASGNLAGIDTILGAGTGDVIIFAGGGTATASYSGGNAPSTGSATTGTDFRTTSFSAQATADSTALDQLAIYTSNGDTVIQLLTQATATGATIVSAVDYVQIVLSNKDFTAITAAFKLDVTGSGLQITLL